jgi:hypothetical protein
MRKFLTAGVTVALAAFVAACGSKGSTGPSFAATITDSAAAAAGQSGADFAGTMMNTFDFGGPAISLSAQSSPRAVALLNGAWMYATHSSRPRYTVKGMATAPVMEFSSMGGCNGGNYITVSGDTTDADNDGIPANETVTLSCDTVANGTTVSYHGTINLQDVAGLYAFHLSINLTENVSDTAGNKSSVVVNGTEDAAFTATLAQDHTNLTLTESVTASGHTSGVGEHYNWDASFTPAGGTLALGSPLPDGALHFNGGFYVLNLADASQNFNFGIQTTQDLAYSAACAGNNPPFTSGVIKGLFNGNNTVGFTVNYNNGCGNAPTVTGTGNATT